MIRVGRLRSHSEHETPSGTHVRLHAETWWAVVAHRWGAGGVSYQRPYLVEFAGRRARIYDHTAIARAFTLGLLVATPLLRRIKQ